MHIAAANVKIKRIKKHLLWSRKWAVLASNLMNADGCCSSAIRRPRWNKLPFPDSQAQRRKPSSSILILFFISLDLGRHRTDTDLCACKTDWLNTWLRDRRDRQWLVTGVSLYWANFFQRFRLKALLALLGGGFIVFGIIGTKLVSSEALYYSKQCNEVYVAPAPRDRQPRNVLFHVCSRCCSAPFLNIWYWCHYCMSSSSSLPSIPIASSSPIKVLSMSYQCNYQCENFLFVCLSCLFVFLTHFS